MIIDDEEIYINNLENKEYKNLDSLFDFIERIKDNETSSSYFYKIIRELLNESKNSILTYIYSNKKILRFLVNNCSIKSFNDLLNCVLNLRNDCSETTLDCKFLKHRLLLYKNLLKELSRKENNTDGICSILIDLIDEQENISDGEYFIDKLFTNAEEIGKLINLIIQTKNKSLIKLFARIVRSVLPINKKKESKKDSLDHSQIVENPKEEMKEPENGKIDFEIQDIGND